MSVRWGENKKPRRKIVIVPIGSKEKEWGLPLVRLGQGRDIDIYYVKEDKKESDKNG